MSKINNLNVQLVEYLNVHRLVDGAYQKGLQFPHISECKVKQKAAWCKLEPRRKRYAGERDCTAWVQSRCALSLFPTAARLTDT